MSETRQDAAVPRRELTGPTYLELGHRDTIDWHYHDMQQLVYPSRGVLAISTALGTWIVPPQRAVLIPARVAHAHQAHGPTQLRTLAFPASVDPLGLDNPAVLTVSGLLREIIVELTSSADPAYTARQRADLERVALDRFVVAGGDTSSASIKLLGIDALEMVAPLALGAPLCRALAPGRPLHGRELVLKGGQIGGPDFFVQVRAGRL